ncbi:acyl-coenzyme A thioesterase 8-like [Glandiceps talaboti]
MAAQQPVVSPPEKENENLRNVLVDTVLNLEELESNLYRSSNHWKPMGNARRLFGGQVVGQALVAAGKTVPPEFHVHSLHAYFVKGGQPKKSIIYQVERTRDGGSYATRSVQARQFGEAVLTMQASFHIQEFSKFHHQHIMPDVPPPEDLLNQTEMTKKHFKKLPESVQNYIREHQAVEIPIEIKPVIPQVPVFIAKHTMKDTDEPKIILWIKARGTIGNDELINRCIAAYFSDLMLASASRISKPSIEATMITSLDHAMWFHAPFRSDEWMLYECESPRSGGGRGFNLGRLWKQDGTLAVSVAQESVLRSEARPPRESKL